MEVRLLPRDITTDRLLLRVPVPGDAQRIFNSYAQDPKVARYLTWKPSKTLDDSKRHIQDRILAWRRGNICTWSIIQAEHDLQLARDAVGDLFARVAQYNFLDFWW